MTEPKDTLKRYLHSHRAILLWKLEGLGERDVRWPHTSTGTNLLGLVKHVASMEFEYFGLVFDRPAAEPMPWLEDDAEDNADMWATTDQSKEWVIDFYHRASAFADQTIEELDLEATGLVPWWGDRSSVTLHQILVHVIAETARHAGHADILREQIDGAVGLRETVSNLPEQGEQWWVSYHERLRRTAEDAERSAK